MKKVFLIFLIVFNALIATSPREAHAQTFSSNTTVGMRRGVAIVMFAGLAGAVLGVSTLSFYGEPQEHISNIWTGLAAGTLVGGAYVISQGQKSTIVEDQQRPTNPYQVVKAIPPLVQYQFDF